MPFGNEADTPIHGAPQPATHPVFETDHELIGAYNIFAAQDAKQLDFSYEGGERDAINVATILGRKIPAVLKMEKAFHELGRRLIDTAEIQGKQIGELNAAKQDLKEMLGVWRGQLEAQLMMYRQVVDAPPYIEHEVFLLGQQIAKINLLMSR